MLKIVSKKQERSHRILLVTHRQHRQLKGAGRPQQTHLTSIPGLQTSSATPTVASLLQLRPQPASPHQAPVQLQHDKPIS